MLTVCRFLFFERPSTDVVVLMDPCLVRTSPLPESCAQAGCEVPRSQHLGGSKVSVDYFLAESYFPVGTDFLDFLHSSDDRNSKVPADVHCAVPARALSPPAPPARAALRSWGTPASSPSARVWYRVLAVAS